MGPGVYRREWEPRDSQGAPSVAPCFNGARRLPPGIGHAEKAVKGLFDAMLQWGPASTAGNGLAEPSDGQDLPGASMGPGVYRREWAQVESLLVDRIAALQWGPASTAGNGFLMF